MKTIHVNGTTLAYKEIGSGDKYLICTQNFFFSDCHMELLGKPPYDYHVFLIYMRGYGESEHILDKEPRDYVIIWGKDVLAFADAMGIDKFFYTGVSHGNWAGWYIAFHRPERLRGFVCCNGIARFRRPEEALPVPPRPQMNPEELAGNRELLEKMAWMERWPTKNPKRLARRQANHLEHLEILMHRKPEEFTVRNTNMAACEAKTEEEFYAYMRAIPVPLLLWIGALDPGMAELALKIADAVPGCQMMTYQHLGHGGADECPEIAARDCDYFFQTCDDRIL